MLGDKMICMFCSKPATTMYVMATGPHVSAWDRYWYKCKMFRRSYGEALCDDHVESYAREEYENLDLAKCIAVLHHDGHTWRTARDARADTAKHIREATGGWDFLNMELSKLHDRIASLVAEARQELGG